MKMINTHDQQQQLRRKKQGTEGRFAAGRTWHSEQREAITVGREAEKRVMLAAPTPTAYSFFSLALSRVFSSLFRKCVRYDDDRRGYIDIVPHALRMYNICVDVYTYTYTHITHMRTKVLGKDPKPRLSRSSTHAVHARTNEHFFPVILRDFHGNYFCRRLYNILINVALVLVLVWDLRSRFLEAGRASL